MYTPSITEAADTCQTKAHILSIYDLYLCMSGFPTKEG